MPSRWLRLLPDSDPTEFSNRKYEFAYGPDKLRYTGSKAASMALRHANNPTFCIHEDIYYRYRNVANVPE